MNIQITTRHFNGSAELQENIRESIEKMNRFNDGIHSVHVILDAEKEHVRKAEIIFHVSNKNICVHAEEENMHKAVDQALLKAERQLKKQKEIEKEHKAVSISEVVSSESTSS
jgi:ribosomal subunit interface protein